MKKSLSVIMIIALLVFAVSAIGSAQELKDLKGKMAVGGFFNWGIGVGNVFKSYDFSETIGGTTYSYSIKNKLQYSFGGKFIYGVAPKIAVAGIVDYQSAKTEVSGNFFGVSASTNYHWLAVNANGMYFFTPEKKFCPFVEAGPGFYSEGGGGGGSSSKFGVDGGVGGMYMINDKLAIDAGGRFHMIFTSGEKTNYIEIHGGVTFWLPQGGGK